MRNDVAMYEKVYQILKNKIESGILPPGYKLPSRANLCKEFDASEKTVRRSLELLERDGLIESVQRKRATVAFRPVEGHQSAMQTLKKVDSVAAYDILKTGVLLCYPVTIRGLSLCRDEEWATPEQILAQMEPAEPVSFWRLSNRLWRFFVARNGNELILRTVDSLGFKDIDPLPGTYAMRADYLSSLKQLVQAVKVGRNPAKVPFDNLSSLYQNAEEPARQLFSESPLRMGIEELERHLFRTKERYSSVYLDLLGLIAIGRYKPGERLPVYEDLQKIYGVSVDTIVKAIRILQEWGVVRTVRGKGVFVAMDLQAMSRIQIDADLIACHLRRYLDSLELISLTVEGVAAHAGEGITSQKARQFSKDLEELWEHAYLYQLSPVAILEFITNHIQYDALRTIYGVLLKNYHIGRSIPKLINHKKNSHNRMIHSQCKAAVDALIEGDSDQFASQAAEMFQKTQCLIVEECRALGYLASAMEVYDGTTLWK